MTPRVEVDRDNAGMTLRERLRVEPEAVEGTGAVAANDDIGMSQQFMQPIVASVSAETSPVANISIILRMTASALLVDVIAGRRRTS